MTATQRFIEDAIKGGYGDAFKVMAQLDLEEKTPYVDRLLLDPKSFQAVGKVRGWEEPKECLIDGVESHCSDTYQNKARNFFQYVLDGKNIEEALQAIE